MCPTSLNFFVVLDSDASIADLKSTNRVLSLLLDSTFMCSCVQDFHFSCSRIKYLQCFCRLFILHFAITGIQDTFLSFCWANCPPRHFGSLPTLMCVNNEFLTLVACLHSSRKFCMLYYGGKFEINCHTCFL